MQSITLTPPDETLTPDFYHPIDKATAALKFIRHIDHVTYVAQLENEQKFIGRWISLGFQEHVRLNTSRFRATHITLVNGISREYRWATMTGLSVSEDANSPINEFVRRYGEGIQRTGYNIDPHVDMEELHQQMKKCGWNFMTPVLTYEDEAGARLKQMFAAPSVPYGPFIEFVQRLIGPNGQAFDSFDATHIDDLYQHYADYSCWLDTK